MHINRKPGELLEVDWAGQTATIVDTDTGEAIPAYIFVATLPYSGYSYVEAFLSQNQECWTNAHINMYNFLGGTTRILVPDNLKTGVDKVTKSEIIINKIYNGSLISKRTVRYALEQLLQGKKTIDTNLGAQGIITLMEQSKQKRFIAHLLYASPVMRGKGIEVIEDIVTVYDIKVKVRVGKKVSKVYLAPQIDELPFETVNESVTFTVSKIACHQMVVMEYEE